LPSNKAEQLHDSEITTAEVLAEVARRRSARRLMEEPPSRWSVLAARFISWFAHHWLFFFNGFFLLYVGFPILAPVLMHLRIEIPARMIYTIYRPLCHQLPQRSFFLFGPQCTYRLEELTTWLGPDAGVGPVAQAFVGNEEVGFKMALCQRDISIYGTILLSGLVYGLVRRRWTISALPWWAYFLFGVLPMLLDGGAQFLSYLLPFFWPGGRIQPYETTPLMRVITGGLFGLATTWLSYPLVQETVDELDAQRARRRT